MVHSQTVHKADPKPYRCPTCQKCFANSSYLSQHARIHAGIKPYKCQVCDRRFTQLCHLQQHIRTHTGEKPYRCQHPGCGKAFSQLSNLQSHSRSHMTDRPYRCNSCYKCFTDEQGLRDHIPKHSETKHLKTFICRICGKSYTQETYLARHMTKHQGVDPGPNMLNLTTLRHQQQQHAALQASLQQQHSLPHQPPHSTPTSPTLSPGSAHMHVGGGSGPLTSPSHVGGSGSVGGGMLTHMMPPHPSQVSHMHRQASAPAGSEHLPDIKPLLDNNGFDAPASADASKSSAFMPLGHPYAPTHNMMGSAMSSGFPFASPSRLPNTTLNSAFGRLSPPASAPSHYLPGVDPSVFSNLFRLQQLRDFAVFPKSEPTQNPAVIHKDYS